MEQDRILKTAESAFTMACQAISKALFGDNSEMALDVPDVVLMQAAGPMAAEIYRTMNRLMIVNVKGPRSHLNAVAERLQDMPNVPPAIVAGEEIDFAMIDEATLIPDSALEVLETIAAQIRQRKTVKYPDGHTQDLPLRIVLSTDTIWCPECKHTFTAPVTMGENDPFPTHLAECPECGHMIGESEWNVIHSNPDIILKMAKFERALVSTYCRVAHDADNEIPIYTVLLNTAGHPKGKGVILHGDIVYPLEEHQIVIAVNKDCVEHLIWDGIRVELDKLSLDQLLIYYASIGFMLHDISILDRTTKQSPVPQSQTEKKEIVRCTYDEKRMAVEKLYEYEQGMMEGFAATNVRKTGPPWEVFIIVIDTASAKIAKWSREPIEFPLETGEFAITVTENEIVRCTYDEKRMALEGMPIEQLRAYLQISEGIVKAAWSAESEMDLPPESEEEEGENREGEEAQRSP